MAMALNNLARAEGHAKIAMYTMIIAAVTNIILDAILIFGLHMGIRGAAIATLTAYILGALYLIWFYLSGRSLLALNLRSIKFEYAILKEIMAIGVASFIRQTAMSLLVILVNRTLSRFGGNVPIAVFGVVMRIVMLVFTPIIGISQGLQPILGFNYGAGKKDKMQTALKLAALYASGVALLSTIVLAGFPKPFISMFSNDPELIASGEKALRLILLAFPTVGFQVIGSVLFQATGKAVQTLLLTLSRQVLFLIPLILFLPNYFGLTGIWISFPISDTLAAILTAYMVYAYRNMLTELK
jgi:putative MATE family efflux protein